MRSENIQQEAETTPDAPGVRGLERLDFLNYIILWIYVLIHYPAGRPNKDLVVFSWQM